MATSGTRESSPATLGFAKVRWNWAVSLVFTCAICSAQVLQASDEPKGKAEAKANEPPVRVLPRNGAEDLPAPFVPSKPRTTENRRELEQLRDFATARSYERQRKWKEALDLYEKMLKPNPDQVVVLRQMSEINFQLGRLNRAVELCKQVVEHDPNDDLSLARITAYHLQRADSIGLEKILSNVLKNPKLDKKAAAYLFTLKQLGTIYADSNRIEQAANAFSIVVDGLDDKSTVKMAPHQLQRVLSNPTASYQMFGVVLLAANRVDQAHQAYQRGLAYDPDDLGLRLGLARTLIKKKQLDRALESIERVLSEKPKVVEPYRLLSETLTALKRQNEILPRLEQALKADSGNPALQLELAENYSKANQLEKARALWSKLIESSANTPLMLELIQSLIKAKQTPEMVKMLGIMASRQGGENLVRFTLSVIASDKQFAQSVLRIGTEMLTAEPPKVETAIQIPLQMLVNHLKDQDSGLRLARWRIAKDPGQASYTDLARVQEQAKDYEGAAKTLVEFFEKFPQERNAFLVLDLGRLWLRAEKKDQAVGPLRDAAKMANDPKLQITAANLLSLTDKVDEAVAIARNVVQAKPEDRETRATLFQILIRHKAEEALVFAKDSVKFDEFNSEYHFWVYEALEKLGKPTESLAYLRSIIDKYPDKEDIQLRLGQQVSNMLVTQGDVAQGQEILEKLLKKFPNDAGVNNDLGYLYADQGQNLEKAEAMTRLAVEQDGENASYLDSLAWALFKRGKLDEAVGLLERAAKIFLDRYAYDADPTILDHLGDAHFGAKNYGKAREAWKRAEAGALKKEPPDKRLAEIRKKLERLDKVDAASDGSKQSKP